MRALRHDAPPRPTNRRRFLQAAGATAAAGLLGCTKTEPPRPGPQKKRGTIKPGFSPTPDHRAAATTRLKVERVQVSVQVGTSRFTENVYVVSNARTADAVIIDPGAPDPRVEGLAKGLRVRAILNTHGHPDHIGANGPLRKALKVPVWGHRADEAFYAMDKDEHLPTHWWTGPGTLTVTGLSIVVIPTPGHTAGSVCFRVGDRIFSGDTLFRGNIGRTWGTPEIKRRQTAQEIAGIKTRLLPLGDALVVHPGHGPSTTLRYERLNNPHLRTGRAPMGRPHRAL